MLRGDLVETRAVSAVWEEGVHRQGCLASEAARTTSHPYLRKEACTRSEVTSLTLGFREKG